MLEKQYDSKQVNIRPCVCECVRAKNKAENKVAFNELVDKSIFVVFFLRKKHKASS